MRVGLATERGDKPLLPKWLPLSVVACAGAVLLLAVVATVWAMLVQWMLWGLGPSQIVNADVLAAQYPTTLFLVALGLLPTLINGLFPSFINLSPMNIMLKGSLLADLIPTFDFMNMIGGECDR